MAIKEQTYDKIGAHDVKHNAFTHDLGTDWVAIDNLGNPVSRAGNEDGVKRAAPQANAYYTGKDFTKAEIKIGEEPEINATETEKAGATAEATAHHPEKETDLSDPNGVKAKDAAIAGANNQTGGEDQQTAGKASGDSADNAGSDPLDHDHDGKKGGTATTSRQRKPAAE